MFRSGLFKWWEIVGLVLAALLFAALLGLGGDMIRLWVWKSLGWL